MVHVVQVLCLVQLTCGTWDERSWWSVYVFGSGRRWRRGVSR